MLEVKKEKKDAAEAELCILDFTVRKCSKRKSSGTRHLGAPQLRINVNTIKCTLEYVLNFEDSRKIRQKIETVTTKCREKIYVDTYSSG